MDENDEFSSRLGWWEIDPRTRIFVPMPVKPGLDNGVSLGDRISLCRAVISGRRTRLGEFCGMRVPSQNILADADETRKSLILMRDYYPNNLIKKLCALGEFGKDPEHEADDCWMAIYGLLVTVSNADGCLPAMDRKMGCFPGTKYHYVANPVRRVVVPVWTKRGIVAAWTYVIGDFDDIESVYEEGS